MCLLSYCCCKCSLRAGVVTFIFIDYAWVGIWIIWAILSTITFKSIQGIKDDFIFEDIQNQDIVTTVVWSIVVISGIVPIVGLTTFISKLKRNQVFSYLIAKVLATTTHFILFLIYLAYNGARDVTGVILTFVWFILSVYFSWVILSFYITYNRAENSLISNTENRRKDNDMKIIKLGNWKNKRKLTEVQSQLYDDLDFKQIRRNIRKLRTKSDISEISQDPTQAFQNQKKVRFFDQLKY